jgi:hypothetical protein
MKRMMVFLGHTTGLCRGKSPALFIAALVIIHIACGSADGGVTGGDITPPADVTGIAGTVASGEVTLNWTDPADTDLDHIEITWTGGSGGSETAAKGVGTITITGLSNGTAYTFTVKAVDDSGNSSAGVSPAGGPLTPADAEFFTFTVETTTANEPFFIPVSGYLNGPYGGKTYNWSIDWGDGSVIQTANGTSATLATGISHSYAAAGKWSITIRPNGSRDAWLGAFGFRDNTTGANKQDNKNKLVSVDSPLQPLMTRTQAQLDGGTAPDYEWAYTFYGCRNPAFTMGAGFGFSSAWDGVTIVGNYFAVFMFSGCSGAAFTMGGGFNLPQGITTAGNLYFASSMFEACSGAAFMMNDVFNLPPNITITTASDSFAKFMFKACSGAAFTMNAGFNLPQSITAVGQSFAVSMFEACSGAAFTMNAVFNLPQGITAAYNFFADSMFEACSGAAFQVNMVFTFPVFTSLPASSFFYTFALGNGAAAQTTRTAASIINSNAAPGTDRNTFGPASVWSDYSSINANWKY